MEVHRCDDSGTGKWPRFGFYFHAFNTEKYLLYNIKLQATMWTWTAITTENAQSKNAIEYNKIVYI